MPAVGLAIRDENRTVLADPLVTAAEITFERADDPLRLDRYVEDLEFDHLSVHALKLSVASPDPPRRDYLDALKAIADENGADSISDHLGFTRDGNSGVEMGHFAPPPFTQAALDATCRNIELIQRHFAGRPFYIENIAYLFQLEGTLREPEFIRGVLSHTGCGWLLDVTNVYANARNFGFDGEEFIAEIMPAASRVQMHLAGGYFDDRSGMYFDSHSHEVPAPVWDLYRFALEQGRGKVDAVFLERDQNFPNAEGWRSELLRARTIADEVDRT